MLQFMEKIMKNLYQKSSDKAFYDLFFLYEICSKIKSILRLQDKNENFSLHGK